MSSSESETLLSNGQKITYKSRGTITLMIMNLALGSFYFGYCIVYFGQLDIDTILKIIDYQTDDSSTAKGLLNGCIPVGALFGALSSSVLITKLSRRNCLLIINICAFLVGGLIYIENFYSLLFFRLCQGFFVGVYSALIPLIIKQLSPNEISGTLGSYMQLNVTLGVFFGVFFAYLLKKITGDPTGNDFWYLVYGFPQITILIQTLVLIFVYPYETPKYLLSVGRQEEAIRLLQVIYKEEYIETILQQKKADIEASMIRKNQQVDTILSEEDSGRSKTNKIPIIVAIHLAALQQLSGINAIAVYGGDIASNATSGELSLLMSSLINFEQILGTFATGILLVKFGRKTILQFGTLLECVADLLVAIGFFIKGASEGSDNTFAEALILLGLFLFMGVFGVSLGPVVWLYIPEVVQPKIVPFSTATNWICASVIIIFFPILTENVLNNNPAILFIIFSAWCAISFAFNMKFIIETKDKSQKMIQEEYQALKMA